MLIKKSNHTVRLSSRTESQFNFHNLHNIYNSFCCFSSQNLKTFYEDQKGFELSNINDFIHNIMHCKKVREIREHSLHEQCQWKSSFFSVELVQLSKMPACAPMFSCSPEFLFLVWGKRQIKPYCIIDFFKYALCWQKIAHFSEHLSCDFIVLALMLLLLTLIGILIIIN